MNEIQNILSRIKSRPNNSGVKQYTRDELLELWMMVAKTIIPNYVLNKNSEKMFDSFFTSDGKGRLIWGTNGTGKTVNSLIYCNILKYMHGKAISESVKVIEMNYSHYGKEYLDRIINVPVLFIHDIGYESKELADFKMTRHLIRDILDIRYDKFQVNRSFITHATTNKNAEELRAFYDLRTYSRFKEMFSTLTIEGEDLRGSFK